MVNAKLVNMKIISVEVDEEFAKALETIEGSVLIYDSLYSRNIIISSVDIMARPRGKIEVV
ncbi:MAG: hypothetical protein N2V75_11680, partial [Methanophagales archaeon]|nr:hypothetical protein [Methanophagales archaeon]